MDKKVLFASLLAAAPLLAQAADPVTVSNVGYDVAAGAFVIHGSNFIGKAYRAPDVRIGADAARVKYYVDDFVMVEAPAGLKGGQHMVTVTPAGSRASAQMPFALAVAVPPAAPAEIAER